MPPSDHHHHHHHTTPCEGNNDYVCSQTTQRPYSQRARNPAASTPSPSCPADTPALATGATPMVCLRTHARTCVVFVCRVLFASPALCRTASGTARAEQVVELAFPVTLSFTPLGDGAGPGKRGAGRERAALPAHALPRPPPPIRLTDCLRVLRCAACLYVWLRLCVRAPRACLYVYA